MKPSERVQRGGGDMRIIAEEEWYFLLTILDEMHEEIQALKAKQENHEPTT